MGKLTIEQKEKIKKISDIVFYSCLALMIIGIVLGLIFK